MKLAKVGTLALFLGANAFNAQAQQTQQMTMDELVQWLNDHNYTEVQVERNGNRIIVNAEGSGGEMRLVYDTDGNLISQSNESSGSKDRSSSQSTDDQQDDQDDDSDDDDEDDDHEDDDDDHEDDDHEDDDDDSGDDDSSDDHDDDSRDDD